MTITGNSSVGFFTQDDHMLSLKASTTRAITSLLRGDYVARTLARYFWPGREDPPVNNDTLLERKAWDRWHSALFGGEKLATGRGYALRPKGIEIGLAHEPADLDLDGVLTGVRRLQRVYGMEGKELDERLKELRRIWPRLVKRYRSAGSP
jgi:hypothetical protein